MIAIYVMCMYVGLKNKAIRRRIKGFIYIYIYRW